MAVGEALRRKGGGGYVKARLFSIALPPPPRRTRNRAFTESYDQEVPAKFSVLWTKNKERR